MENQNKLTLPQWLLSPATEQKPMVYLGQYNPAPKIDLSFDTINSEDDRK